MSAQSQASRPDPGLLFSEFFAYQRAIALKTAVSLDLFTHIDDGAVTATSLAAQTGAAERGIRILSDYLVVAGHLTKLDGCYGLTANSRALLSKRSPAYMGSIGDFLTSDQLLHAFLSLPTAVKSGGALPDPEGALAPDHPMWVAFARSMAPLMRVVAEPVAEQLTASGPVTNVLDIAAGHGMYGIAVALRNSQAQVTGLDWASVLAVARENATRSGVGERYRTITGSAFEADFGSGYDLVLVPNFCHHFGRETNVDLFKKIRFALAPGGRVAIVEFVPNDDRVTPPAAAAFSLMMLAGTPEGEAYTFREYQEMLESTGFHEARMTSLDELPWRLITAV
jgi:2-polyprenyl-3-methyl-5-hydroxy-6-metoxy-1,4-benzoquinol methylase